MIDERTHVKEIDDILGEKIPILDHGFIRVIDYMGDDASIVQAARVSYGKGTKQISQDKNLINYLMRNKHTSPFEMCELKLHVKLPIFVARQWIRHRTASLNEYSARYSVLDNEFYIPEVDNIAAQSATNKQGREEKIETKRALEILDMLKSVSQDAYEKYDHLLTNDDLSREIARTCLPVNFYTQWYWKMDLHNLLHFIRLRISPHAQYEIRVYAEAILDILKKWVPLTCEAFINYELESFTLSKKSLMVVKKLIKGEHMSIEESGLSKREWDELFERLS